MFLRPFFFPLLRPLLVFNFRVPFACSRLCSLLVSLLLCSLFAFALRVHFHFCVHFPLCHFVRSLLCSLPFASTSFAFTFFCVHFCVHFPCSLLVFSPFCRPVLTFLGPARVRCFWGVCPQLFGWVVFFCTFEHSCASFFGLAPSVELVIFGATHLDSRSR